MFESLTQRRYLIPFRAARLPQQITDVLVIGGGVAGLRAAIAAAESGAEVLLVTKDTVDQSNTWYAQGGIAAVLQPLDSVESHIKDTEIVRLRRGGAALSRIDQSQDRHRRRPCDGLPRRRNAGRHGDGAVPSHRALRRGFEPRADHRSRARRGRVSDRSHRLSLYEGVSQGS